MFISPRKSKKIWVSLILATAVLLFGQVFFASVKAQTEKKVDYHGETIVDSDLDGLTDQGEIQLYQTNPAKPDTDGDGYLDGAEILVGTNPLDINDPINSENVNLAIAKMKGETPWAWYVARSAGLIGFIFLWITIFLGLAIRNPLLKKLVAPFYSFGLHCFLSALAVFWALIHGTSLLFDKFIGFRLIDITVPFISKTTFVDVNYLGLGIMAFYFMVIMTFTSYIRKHLKHVLWRIIHFLNPIAFIFVVIHGYFNGTDMKNKYVGGLFIASAIILVLLYFLSLMAVIIKKFKKDSPGVVSIDPKNNNNDQNYANQNYNQKSGSEN